ncbi:hypothetical protein M0805_003421 [Coniferiporia weirii]|nr:hypothetical protein M0805_003421 [Coniferiporia weirii]
MCGILVSVQRVEDVNADFEILWGHLKVANAARGPDAYECHQVVVATDEGSSLDVRFFASELRLRGDKPVIQPHRSSKAAFCWNGEVFEGLELSASENDGVKLFQKIEDLSDPETELPRTLQDIEGPYALTYFHSDSKRIYFGRDPLGRRSLLIHRPTHQRPIFLVIFCKGSPAKVNRLVTNPPPMADPVTTIPEELSDAVDGLLAHLSRSVHLQVRDIPYHEENGQARVAILFSGGIDSTVLAYMADRHLPEDEPIDLLNVAFENPRKTRARDGSGPHMRKRKRERGRTSIAPEGEQKRTDFDSFIVPDRITGLEELVELRKLCPRRRWNFLNGLGSDELLGGYGRHRTAFNSGGWSAVIDELQLEVDRIPARNLGRDDRVISSHGKEARHPFLSLSVVNFLANLPVHYKTDPRLPLGVGDKMLLRLATKKVGLELASGRKKRAMQFGSHSARMETGESGKRGDSLLH